MRTTSSPSRSAPADPGALFEAAAPLAYGLALRLLGDPEAAAAVVEESFARQAAATPMALVPARARLLADVHRRAVRRLRARPGAGSIPSDTDASITDALRLTYLDGLSLDEVAQRCGVSRQDAARAVRHQLAGAAS